MKWVENLPFCKRIWALNDLVYFYHEFKNCNQVTAHQIWKKFDTLQSKPSEMSFEKELLNAVVCRLDALEAELIATKKAIHEALTRQDELLQ